ncbi:hypothetical protein ACFV3R_21120 [Streptomyces sp. NPDC059740]|uniref:hypothetical protein n=1 Tax=Streptomyces sp. NPDC059740 TaxID=3346926 RepID=UPI00366A40EE
MSRHPAPGGVAPRATPYRNPVLDADWSDPSVVRAGEDHHGTASGFGRTPGPPPHSPRTATPPPRQPRPVTA